ncbi:TPA: ATP-binding protein [Enterobacter bugandensis]|nr:ATP-binding protein [Enterobacter bugandensis]
MNALKTLNEELIIANLKAGKAQETKLETDDRVLARVTDGIYRLPGSALRELISNAYDADAENVTINTDVPRFNSMTIRDDGNGMSIDTLVNMIRHIGGSAKRTEKGRELNVTDENDSTLTPIKKRKIIGKIGIGLFSVAQLTRDFEIITKQKGSNHYTRAKVELFNYSESIPINESSDRGKSFQTGNVKIWIEKAENLNAHGTDIILHNIKQSAKDQLRSVDIWGQTENETESDNDDSSMDEKDSSKAILPDFHVGFLSDDQDGINVYNDANFRAPVLPWDDETSPSVKFHLLYNAILDKTKNAVSPKLGQILDNYLNMIWTLGLSIPLEYIDKHPFSLSRNDISDIYIINNNKKGQAYSLPDDLSDSTPIGDYFNFSSHKKTYDFNVFIDGIKLFRPLKYTNLPESKAMIKKPILFIGKFNPNLSSLNVLDSAGALEFEAYLLWSPKVSPRDHTGSLIRIHDASGIMFDETFMKHQVAEHTIKSQLTVEIFIKKGLDSALNIDRESFNIAHPHYQIVMRWLHSAIRQVVYKYKQHKRETKVENDERFKDEFTKSLNTIVKRSYITNKKDPNEISNLIIVKDRPESSFIKRNSNEDNLDNFIISESKIKTVFSAINKINPKQEKLISRSEAILQILDSYNLLEYLTIDKQEQLVIDLIELLKVEG